jgi:hypothetical protein
MEKTTLMDVSNGGENSLVGIENLRNAIISGCTASGLANVVNVECEAPLRASPFSEPALSHSVACGQRFFFLLDKPVQQIRIGSTVVQVEDGGSPKDVSSLNVFVESVGAGLKMGLVAAGKNVTQELKDKIRFEQKKNPRKKQRTFP